MWKIICLEKKLRQECTFFVKNDRLLHVAFCLMTDLLKINQFFVVFSCLLDNFDLF